MKKVATLVFVVVLALCFIGCSSLNKVENVIREENYVSINMEDETSQTGIKKAVANAVLNDYDKIEALSLDNGKAKLYVWAVLPSNVMGLASLSYAIVVEFSSKNALVKELLENAEFKAIVESAVGEEITQELAYDKGFAVDNCLTYAKGPLASKLYETLSTVA